MYLSFYIMSTFILQLKASQVKVNLKEGVIFGIKEMTVFEQKWYVAFYGVPYAKAPVGRLRFQNPKPLRLLKPYDASTEYHGACAQAHIVHRHAMYGYEDCLRLNIYTPSLPKHKNPNLKATIVWIHGYAFTSSFSHVYGPDFLIEHDIIFISLTYRIGPFGFLKVNESDSNINMGLRDTIAGLKWIRKNIKYFGGDRNKITLMGSGSGGTIASLLLLTKYKKLFQKLIIQSGTMYSPSIFQGSDILERFRLQKEIEKAGFNEYTKAPAQVIVAASNKIYSSKEIISLQKPLVPFSPVIEEESNHSLLSKFHFREYENNESDDFNIPILTGFTTQESMSEVIPFIHNPSYLKSFGTYFKYMVPFTTDCSYNYTTKTYTSIANKIIKQYFKSYPNISLEEFLKYTSDAHRYPIYKFIRTHLLHNSRKIFVYKFNYDGKFNVFKSTSLAGLKTRIKGAAQGDDLCYILKCEPLWESYVKLKNGVNYRDRNFIKQMTSFWANFAIFGNPTPTTYNGNITWLPMTSKEDNLLLIGNRFKIISSKKELKMYEFWNKIYDDYYSSKHCKTSHDEL